MNISWKVLLLLSFIWLPAGPGLIYAQDQTQRALAEERTEKELFTGHVVHLSKALEAREIRFSEEVKDHVVLETESGELIPILADWRGRAFYQDERLRNRKVEVIGSRRSGIPYLQVLMIFTFDEAAHRQYTDYWCDICSIPMYEIKPCECCQGDIRIRYQPQDLPNWLRADDHPSPKSSDHNDQ